MAGTGEQGETQGALFLVAADWRSRALTLAELQESGYEVTTFFGLRDVAKALLPVHVAPSLIVVDAQGDEHATPPEVATLLDVIPGVPVILITGVYGREAWEGLRPRLAALLHRPVAIRQIVAAVQRVVPAPELPGRRGEP